MSVTRIAETLQITAIISHMHTALLSISLILFISGYRGSVLAACLVFFLGVYFVGQIYNARLRKQYLADARLAQQKLRALAIITDQLTTKDGLRKHYSELRSMCRAIEDYEQSTLANYPHLRSLSDAEDTSVSERIREIKQRCFRAYSRLHIALRSLGLADDFRSLSQPSSS